MKVGALVSAFMLASLASAAAVPPNGGEYTQLCCNVSIASADFPCKITTTLRLRL